MTQPVLVWQRVLTLSPDRAVLAGSPENLRTALRRGADLRIYSKFRHNEHIDTASSRDELIEESMDMRVTYLVDDRWAAGALTLRQPVELPDGFGPRPSLSLFLYNENGEQAIARLYLDGAPVGGPRGASPPADHGSMPKYHEFDRWDDGTNAPSSNFAYDFETLQYFVRDDWTEALHHAADGTVRSGSVEELANAFAAGAEIKVGIQDPCADMLMAGGPTLAHEVFIQAGSCYFYTQTKVFIASIHPLVRVAPAVPLRYRSQNWDYGWLIVRTDGHTAGLIYDPYTLQYRRTSSQRALRWFYR
jgi:hypothetical protein